MANVSASTRAQNSPNYLGKLVLTGQNKTPFSTMAMENGTRMVGAHTFPLNTNYALETASQNTVSESTAASAGTPTTYVKAQDTNVIQLMRYAVQVTYKKLSEKAKFSGVNINDPAEVDALVRDEMMFQLEANMKQMKNDIEYSFLQGSYTAESAYATNQQTRGIIEACASNTVDGSSAALTEALMNDLLDEMATNGAQFERVYCFVNSFQLRKINDIYSNDPESRMEGGRNIRVIHTPYGEIGVVYTPRMPAATLLLADMAYVKPAFSLVPGQPEVFFEEKAFDGAVRGGQLYTQVGLDYCEETYHGTITSLATS